MITTIAKGDETISIRLSQHKNITGLTDTYSLDGGSVAEAANLSLRMAKNIIIEKLQSIIANEDKKKIVKGYDKNEKPKNIYVKSYEKYSIYADDQKFTQPAIIGFSKNKKRDPIYSFTEDGTFVLFYDGKPIPEITTRTEVDFLNRSDVKSVYMEAVSEGQKQKSQKKQTTQEVKYTLMTPFMVKAILDSAGFGSVIPLSIERLFGFSNFNIIKESLPRILENMSQKRLDIALKNELLKFQIGSQLSIVYALNSSDILGAINGLRLLRNLHDTLPAVGVIDITKAGGGQRGYDNMVFLFSIILENIYKDIPFFWGGDFERFSTCIQEIRVRIDNKINHYSSIIGSINYKSLKEIIRNYLVDSTATENISNIVTIFTIVTEIVQYFIERQDIRDNFLKEISRLYDSQNEYTMTSCEEFTLLGFHMHKWYQVKRFWPDTLDDSVLLSQKYFTTLIDRFQDIYIENLKNFIEAANTSRFDIFLYEAACGHDLLSNTVTDWLTELYQDELTFVKQFKKENGYTWDAMHEFVVKKLQKVTGCQICLTSFEVTQIRDLDISGKYTLWGLNSSLCSKSEVKKEIAIITQTEREKISLVTTKTPRGEPAPSPFKCIPILDLNFTCQITVVDLQKYLSATQRETINAQRISQLMNTGATSMAFASSGEEFASSGEDMAKELTSSMEYGYERRIAIQKLNSVENVLQVLPIVTRCDEASGVECPRALYQFGDIEYTLNRRYSIVRITFSVTQQGVDPGLYRLTSNDQSSSLETKLQHLQDLNLKELLIFLKQNVLYKSSAVDEITGGALTNGTDEDYNKMCLNISRNIDSNPPVGYEDLFKLIKLGLFNPGGNESLKYIVITPDSIDGLVSYLFRNGKQNLIVYVLNIIKQQLKKQQLEVGPAAVAEVVPAAVAEVVSSRGKARKKKNNDKEIQNDPYQVIVKIDSFLEIINSLKATFFVSDSLEISDFCMLNANLHVIQMAKKSGLFISKVKKEEGIIYFHLPDTTELIGLSFDTLASMSQEDRVTFEHRISELFSHEISGIIKREEAVALREEKVTRQQEELIQQQEEITLQKEVFEYMQSLLNEDQQAEFNKILSAGNKRKLNEISSIPSGNGCKFAIVSGGAGCPPEFLHEDTTRNVRQLKVEEPQLTYVEYEYNMKRAISNAADGTEFVEQSSTKKSRTDGQSSRKRSNDANDEEVTKYQKYDQHGGASELKDGDIIVGKQNPDGTIEYMLYSDYFKLVFGIVSEPNKEILKPQYTALGVPIPPKPVTEFSIGDWVPANKATALESRFTLVPFIQNGINGYKLEDKKITGLQSQNFSYSNPEKGQEVTNTIAPQVNAGGKRTRRQKKKTAKRKTRKHKKIKYKKYTRPFKLKRSKKNTYRN